MGRSVIANTNLEKYLQKFPSSEITFGVIVGQSFENGELQAIQAIRSPNQTASTLMGLDVDHISDHILNVTRMIPGSFCIVGVFVTCKNDIFEDTESSQELKSMVQKAFRYVANSKDSSGNWNTKTSDEKIVLCYSPEIKKAFSKSINVKEPTSSFVSIEWKFINKTPTWYTFETNYNFNEEIPFFKSNNLHKNLNMYLDIVDINLQKSITFIDNKKQSGTKTIQNYLSELQKKEQVKNFKVMIYTPSDDPAIKERSIAKFHGSMHPSGIVHSRIFVPVNTSFKEISEFIRNDILKSIDSRHQLCCDSFGEDLVPGLCPKLPKRVFFNVPESGGLQYAEYIFHGEKLDVVIEQAKEILDLEIDSKSLLPDLETVSEGISPSLDTSSGSMFSKDSNKSFYIFGIIGALLMLFVSIIVGYLSH